MFDEAQAAKNAKRLEGELDRLENGHWNMLKRDYRKFWAHVKEINELFKSLKPLSRDDREKLWNRMNSICESCKEKQQGEIDNREAKSKIHRNWIIKQIESCRPLDGMMATLSLGALASNVEEVKDMGKRLKETSQYFTNNKDEMIHEHKSECFERLKEVRHALDVWWDGYKSHRENKHSDFQTRVRANIDKNRERYQHTSEALRKMEASADDLRGKIRDAYNDNWRDKAYGWLSELEDKIADTERHLRRIEEWIREDEDKLNR